MKQKQFNKILYRHGKSDLNLTKGWKIYLKCLELFKKENGNTIKYLEDMGTMETKEKLRWRNKLAESGIELTPDQIDDYILILSLAMMSA